MHAYVYGGAAILAVGMIIAGFLIGGRFTAVGVATQASIVIVDRLTGSAKACFPATSSCRALENSN